MKIGRINSTQSPAAQGTAGVINPAATPDVGAPIVSIGRTATEIGTAYAVAQRKANMVTDYHNSVTEMHKTLNDLDDELQQDPDFDGYNQKYRQRFDEKRDELLGGLEDPETREKVSQALDDMDITSTGAVQKLTWTRKASQGRADLMNNVEYWKNQGDLEQVKALITDGENSMLLSREEGEGLRRGADHEITIARARQDIQANPYKFVKASYPSLSQNDLISLDNEAEIERNQREAQAEKAKAKLQQETGSQALDLYYDGKLTPAWLKSKHKARSLDDSDFSGLMDVLLHPPKGSQETDLFTYSVLKDQASRGILTPGDVLKQLNKLTPGDAKGLIDESLKKDDSDPKKIEVNTWGDYVKGVLVGDTPLKDMDKEQRTKYSQKLVAYYRGVEDLQPGQIEDFAKELVKEEQKEGLFKKIGNYLFSPENWGPAANYPDAPGHSRSTKEAAVQKTPKTELGKNWPDKVPGVPDVLIKDIAMWLEQNGKPVTAKNIQFIYKKQTGGK